MIIKNIVCLFLISCLVSAQTYYFDREFGKFENAVAFKVSPAGFIYAIDAESSEIIKIDSLGEVIKYNGGYGWDNGLFDNPVDLSITGLNILITDMNNHRIQFFDSELNYLTQLKSINGANFSEDNSLRYPSSCTVSTMGDIFILESENKRILKLDPSGKFLLKFGDYESGEYTLQNPIKIDAAFNNIFVLDKDRILIFDLFGNGIAILKTNHKLTNLNIFYNKIFFNNKSEIFAGEFIQDKFQIYKIDLSSYEFDSEIIQCVGNGEFIIVLLKDRMVQFKKKKG